MSDCQTDFNIIERNKQTIIDLFKKMYWGKCMKKIKNTMEKKVTGWRKKWKINLQYWICFVDEEV